MFRQLLFFILTLLTLVSCKNKPTSFEFVVLPDTQSYIEKWPEIYLKQMQWLAENSSRFSFVLHEGDLTQYNSPEEWELVRRGFSLLDGKIPYTFSLGNHDMGSEPRKFADTRNTAEVNKAFSSEEMKVNGKMISSFPKGTVDNMCSLYDAGGMKWLVFSLEFGVRNSTIEWAKNIIESNSDKKVIINTHAYMYEDDTRMGGDDWWQPQGYGVGKDAGDEAVNNGEQIWGKLAGKYENVIMVFSGHVLKRGVGTLVSEGEHGNKVYQMLANYQEGVDGCVNGGNGFLRIIKVDIKSKMIDVKTYSPWLGEYKTNNQQQFSFENVPF